MQCTFFLIINTAQQIQSQFQSWIWAYLKANPEARRAHYMWCLRFYTEAIYQEYLDGVLKQTIQISSHFVLLAWVCVCVFKQIKLFL